MASQAALASFSNATVPPPAVPSPSNTTSVISTFPPELLSLVFIFGSKDWDLFKKLRWNYLRAASLVCRGWRDQAQRLLWDDIILHKNITADLLFNSAAFGRYRTRTIHVNGEKGGETEPVGMEVTRKILAGLKGVQHLTLDGMDEDKVGKSLDVDVFFFPSLSGLRELHLSHNVLTQRNPFPGMPFPFLKQLWISGCRFKFSNPFSLFSAPTIIDLSLSSYSLAPSESHGVGSLISTASRNVRRIFLYGFHPLPSAYSQCVKLKRLDLAWYPEEFSSVVSSLPRETRLKVLAIDRYLGHDEENAMGMWNIALRDVVDHPSLSELRLIVFGSFLRVKLEAAGAKEVLESFERRGIEVEFEMN